VASAIQLLQTARPSRPPSTSDSTFSRPQKEQLTDSLSHSASARGVRIYSEFQEFVSEDGFTSYISLFRSSSFQRKAMMGVGAVEHRDRSRGRDFGCGRIHLIGICPHPKFLARSILQPAFVDPERSLRVTPRHPQSCWAQATFPTGEASAI